MILHLIPVVIAPRQSGGSLEGHFPAHLRTPARKQSEDGAPAFAERRHRSGRGAMDGFVATFSNRLDAKGRVSVPASFRAVLAREGRTASIATRPSTGRRSMPAATGSSRRSERARHFETFSEDHESLSTAFYGESGILKIDPDGRIILPEEMRDYAGIGER